jgi:hypothetical protein
LNTEGWYGVLGLLVLLLLLSLFKLFTIGNSCINVVASLLFIWLVIGHFPQWDDPSFIDTATAKRPTVNMV